LGYDMWPADPSSTREQSWDNIAGDLDALLVLAHTHNEAQSRAELRRIIPQVPVAGAVAGSVSGGCGG